MLGSLSHLVLKITTSTSDKTVSWYNYEEFSIQLFYMLLENTSHFFFQLFSYFFDLDWLSCYRNA